MQFAKTWEKVLSGEKTQTRRLVKGGEWLQHDDADHERCQWHAVRAAAIAGGRLKWMEGKTYAVQPGRNQKAVGRIRITAIRRQDVRDMKAEEIRAEGFASEKDFFQVWIAMHDPRFSDFPIEDYNWPLFLGLRPDERYQAWVLEFTLVQDAE